MGSIQNPVISPSLPVKNPCLSYWQRTTRAFPHLQANRTTPVPTKSKYVVIGSGISGALTAFELIENGAKAEEILILEAREAASGASSRNAGHVRPDAFRGYQFYSRLHGSEQALKILENERAVLEKVNDFVKAHDVHCDFHLTSTFDVCMTPEFAAYEAASFETYKKAGGDTSHIKFYSGTEAQEKTGVGHAYSAYEWPAGSSHPAKLAHWLIDAVIDKGAKLFTYCPALSVSSHTSEEFPQLWEVSTPRGKIIAEKIIHCTNAYADFLLPHLGPLVTPNRAQAHSLIATPSFSGDSVLTKTFSLRYSLDHFYSLIQRRGDGTLILGVSRSNPTLSAATLATRETFDDRYFNQEMVDDAMKQFNLIFPAYGADEMAYGEGLEHPWTGIIGMTGDHVPFVGEIEDLPGQFICAGFNGHGMARIFTCAPGVAKLVLGKGWDETQLPECFQFSTERLSKISGGNKIA